MTMETGKGEEPWASRPVSTPNLLYNVLSYGGVLLFHLSFLSQNASSSNLTHDTDSGAT
jgi:hypothetical protein